MTKDSWENAFKFSILGMPILIDKWLIGGERPVEDQGNKVLMALNEKIKLAKESLPIKEIEILDIKPTILKVDRFDSWIRVDGIVDIELTYKPMDPGLLEEELNIDSFLHSMDLAKDDVEPEAVQWDRFFVNEDLTEEDDEYLDDLEREELDEDDDDEIGEDEFYRYDKDKSSCVIVREKNFSVIIDIGEKSIEDKDLLAVTRADFTNAEIITKRDVYVDIILGVEVRGETRDALEFDTNWQGVSLNTQGSYSLAQSEIRIAEIVDYHVVPEIDELRNDDGSLQLQGVLNIQLAFYPEAELSQRRISIINLRKPIAFTDIVTPFQGEITDYKLHINDIQINLDEARNIEYEAMVELWLYETPVLEVQQEVEPETEPEAVEEARLDDVFDLLQDPETQAENITEVIIEGLTESAPESTFIDILDEYENSQTLERPEESAPLAIDFLDEPKEFADILEAETENQLPELEAFSEQEADDFTNFEDYNLKVLSTEDMAQDFDEAAFVDELLQEDSNEDDRLPDLESIDETDFDETFEIQGMDIQDEADTLDEIIEPIERIEELEPVETIEELVPVETNEELEPVETIEELVPIESTDQLPPPAAKTSGPKINMFKGYSEKPRQEISKPKIIEEPVDEIKFDEEIKFTEEESAEVKDISTFRTRRARRLGSRRVTEVETVEAKVEARVEDKTEVKIEEKIEERIVKKDQGQQASSAERKYRLSFYVVKEGETLESIAQKFSMTSNDILKDNKIAAVNPGDSILIRKHRE